MNSDFLAQTDAVVADLIQAELQRQRDHLELIASENFTSAAVLAARLYTDYKYAEGLPGKRYYGGCEHIDRIEQPAIDRAGQLFVPPMQMYNLILSAGEFCRLPNAAGAWGHYYGMDLSHGDT